MNERLDMQNIIWASVYGASFALEVRSHLSLGRELTDKDVERFIEEAAAVADWEQEAAHKAEAAE
jgi:hypothetical protein